jgi:hypothetical protein
MSWEPQVGQVISNIIFILPVTTAMLYFLSSFT